MNWETYALDFLKASILRPLILVGATACILHLLRVKHPASRHAIWTATLLGILLTPVASVLIPHVNVRVPAVFNFGRTVPPQKSSAPLEPVVSVSNATQPSTQGVPPTSSLAEASSTAAVLSVSQQKNPMPFTLWLYAAGLLLMIAYRASGSLLLRRILSRSKSPKHAILRESDDIVAPVTAGIFRPVILLPKGWRHWDSRVRRAVLAHEFAHIRRKDAIVSEFGRFVKCVLWFQPIAWWVDRRIANLSEIACDLEAMKTVGTPSEYAQILLDFSANIKRAGYRAVLPGLGIRGTSNLTERINYLLSPTAGKLQTQPRPRLFLGLIGVPVVCVAAIAGFSVSQITIASPPVQQVSPQIVPAPPEPPAPIPQVPIPQSAQAIPSDAGVLSGRLRLADGSPAADVEIIAMLGPVRDGDMASWTTKARTRTDNFGQYGLTVPAGLYTIAASWPSPLPTYYPGVTNSSDIQTVAALVGRETSGLDFAVDRKSGVRVRGRIVPAPGPLYSVELGTYLEPRKLDVSELFGQPGSGSYLGIRPVRPDGSFEFSVVPSNVYALRIFPENAQPKNVFPGQRFVVGNDDLNVIVPMQTLVNGRVVLEGGSGLPVDGTEGRLTGVVLSRTPGIKADGPDGYTAAIRRDGSFTIALKAGQYRFSLVLPFGYYRKSLSYGTTDLLQAPLSLSGPASSEITAVVTTTPPDAAKSFITVRGDFDLGQAMISPLTAVLYAEGSDGFGYFPMGASQHFEIHGVPPGTYKAYASGTFNDYGTERTIVVGNNDVNDVYLPLTIRR